MEALVSELRERTALVSRGGGEKAVERHRSRGKLTARERIDRLVDSGTRLPRAERARRLGALRRGRAGGGHRHGDRSRRGPPVRDRRQRRDGQGRLLLPADGEEASPSAGGRATEPPPLPLPRRLGRRVPPATGRGLPRSRPLRAHLLQPGAPLRARHPADRVGHGLLHRGRGVRAGDVGRDGDRSRDRDDLHRRPAPGEGRDGPGRHRRGARRRRRPRPPLGSRRPLRDLGRARACHLPRDRSSSRSPTLQARGSCACRSRRRSTRPTSTGSFPRTSGTSWTRAR